jgi:hypothetical protein
MAYKIESAQWTIPVTGLQYTDVRPVIAGDTLEDILEGARNVSKAVGNEKLYERLSGGQTALTGALTSSQRIIGDGVLFNKEDHTYSKNGKPYLSGSTFAHMFEKEFPRDAIAQKVSDKTGNEVEDVLAAWDAKGQISLDYGTLVHKCVESFLSFGADATPTNQYLADIIGDWDDVFDDLLAGGGAPEHFVQDDLHQLCGVIDFLDTTNHAIYDWKTGDIHQKVQNTLGKEWPNDRLSLYTLQLNFYRYICEQNGIRIKNLYIGWLNGEHWEKIKVDIVDVRPYLEEVWKPTK